MPGQPEPKLRPIDSYCGGRSQQPAIYLSFKTERRSLCNVSAHARTRSEGDTDHDNWMRMSGQMDQCLPSPVGSYSAETEIIEGPSSRRTWDICTSKNGVQLGDEVGSWTKLTEARISSPDEAEVKDRRKARVGNKPSRWSALIAALKWVKLTKDSLLEAASNITVISPSGPRLMT